MEKILIATPMIPPTLGGPAIHAVNISKYFKEKGNTVELFNFEKLNRYPAGIRHLFAFVEIFYKSMRSDKIFAFDGFSVALPTLLASKILRKKIYLRIGGDLVHEQAVENGYMYDMESFYKKLKNREISLNNSLKLKLTIQEYIYKNVDGIIFTSNWQKNIYLNYYKLPSNLFVINNPMEFSTNEIKNYDGYKDEDLVFLSATRDVAFKNLVTLKRAFESAKEEKTNIFLDTNVSSRENLLSRMMKAHAYVCVSLSDISPNTVLDALSLEVPVILTKNTGFYEILEKSNVAKFIDPYSQTEIKEAILSMCDEKTYADYKQNLREFNQKSLWPETWETLFKKYEEIIQSM